MAVPVLELKNVFKEYGGEVPYLALKGINLKINEGELVSIIGPSGSGKSTLMHILGCLDKPTSGEVLVEGKHASKMGEDELSQVRLNSLGFVFQAFNLASTLSVFKNVELPLLINETGEARREVIVNKCLQTVQLSGKKQNFPSQLSGGEKQRVAIARALSNDPKIILADEPTGNLDSHSSKPIMEFITNLSKKHGKTVILVTHDAHIAAMAERIISIKDGKIEKDVKRGRK
ncbi:hypothetical protein COU37_03730 [Candidatus Micrarchaeota archaeon CG10_big_fil_rev_8_21_14_0_10_45_29]|nr:MAG: hypothetical protein COU37_03730 [Candidatus Micrarchaeota archaeon CG10_big_fil_rev_8_21_14_0_10_45_29]